MLFREVIGQNDAKQHLIDMVQHNRLSHALLFLGKEGSGALPLAMAFANYIAILPPRGAAISTAAPGPSLFGSEEELPPPSLPASPDAADAWMEKQAAFNKASQMVHPDIHYSYPVIPRKSGDKPVSTDYAAEWREFMKQHPYGNAYDWLQFIGAENKQGNITAHECSDIIRKLNLKSYESGYKILLMWMPEYLGNEGNKLLKLIEEPPDDTLFILVAESESLILPTILSRTQLVVVPPLDNESICKALMGRGKLSADAAMQTAGVCDGNYREALMLLQHAGEDWLAQLREWLNAIVKTGPIAQVKWVEEAARMGREKQKQFLRYFNHLLEQSIRLQVMPPESLFIPDAEKDFALRLNKLTGMEQQEAIINELDRASYYIERNANPKMLFHALTIKIYHIIQNKSIILVE